MKTGLARPVTPADSPTFRAGLASFLVHATIMCLLIGGGLFYPKLLSFREITPEPKAPPETLTLTEIPPPPPPVLPAPTPAPAASAPGSAINAVPTPAPIPVPQTKQALHKQDGIAKHHTHKPPAAVPSTPLIPMAKAVPPKAPPKALPVLPPEPVVKATPNKIPPHHLPIAPTVIAPVGKPQVTREATSPKPAAPKIPTLPAMPPPKALPAEIAPPAVPTLPAMPPPRAQAIPIPVPVALPAPAPTPPAPVPVAAPVAVALPAPVPAALPEPVEPPRPIASPDFTLVPGPDRTEFPHPPYPYAARNQGLTGTVVMNVRFDERGGVVSAEIAQSSGVPLLDAATKSFINSHWHLPMYAGQAVTVPIVYVLDKAR